MRDVIQASDLSFRASRGDGTMFYLVVPAADAELPTETVTGGTIICAAAVLKHTHTHTSNI